MQKKYLFLSLCLACTRPENIQNKTNIQESCLPTPTEFFFPTLALKDQKTLGLDSDKTTSAELEKQLERLPTNTEDFVYQQGRLQLLLADKLWEERKQKREDLWSQGISALKALLEQQPNHPKRADAFYLMAVSFGHWSKSCEEERKTLGPASPKGLELKPQQLEYLASSGAYFSRLSKEFPEFEKAPKVFLAFAEFLSRENDLDAAAQMLQRVSKSEKSVSDAVYARYRLAVLYSNAGRFSEAMKVLAESQTFFADNPGYEITEQESMLLMASLYAQYKQPDKAVTFFSKVFGTYAEIAVYALAREYLQRGAYAKSALVYSHWLQSHAPYKTIASGESFWVADIGPLDGLYEVRSGLIGRLCMAQFPMMSSTGEGWFGGPATCDNQKVFFYQIRPTTSRPKPCE